MNDRIRKPAEFETRSLNRRQILARDIFLSFLPTTTTIPGDATNRMPLTAIFPAQYPVVVVAISLVVAYNVLRAIYNLFFHPLSAIPGPWYAAVSNLWLTTHVLRLRQCKTIHTLFEIYGPVVRVGPNKIVFNDLSTTLNVYSISKFDKSDYYKSLLTYVSFFFASFLLNLI